MSVNKVILVGNVGKDPDVRHLESGASVASFTLATTERFKDRNNGGEYQEQTEWHNIVCWRNLADIVEKYVVKGTQLYVEGKLRTRSWDDKTTGQKRYITEINADTIQLLGKKGDNAGSQNNSGYAPHAAQQNQSLNSQSPQNSASQSEDNADDDLPF